MPIDRAAFAYPFALLFVAACARAATPSEREPAATSTVDAGAPAAPRPSAQAEPPHAAFETLTRKLEGGVTMSADLYRAPGDEPKDAPRPVLVCFHATRSSRGEYSQIAPEFVARGFHVFAVDLRFGGPGEIGNRKTKERTGVMNATWKSAVELLGREPTPIEAYDDFPAILAWTRELRPMSKIGLVGSSYSASLVMVWAAEHPKTVDAVYAFSPGEWIDGWSVATKTKKLTVPCFVTCGSGDVDTQQAKKLLAKLEQAPMTYLPADEGQNGLHGVGTLHMRVDASRAEMWKRLDAALAWLRPVPAASTPEPRSSPR